LEPLVREMPEACGCSGKRGALENVAIAESKSGAGKQRIIVRLGVREDVEGLFIYGQGRGALAAPRRKKTPKREIRAFYITKCDPLDPPQP